MIEQLRNLKTTPKRVTPVCYRCGINGNVKRWKFTFSYNKSAYICAPCCNELGGAINVVNWLEKNAKAVVSK